MIKFVVLLMVIVGVLGESEYGPIRVPIPQDLGTPACIFNGNKCTPEDYAKGAEYRRSYIERLVNRHAENDVKAPACMETKSCSEDEIAAYNKKLEARKEEIMEHLKKQRQI
uniref:Uncharacterized protein n=1 Tax=Megaselia scalaris TaxID=36166 RepID=T1GRT7_MEGSC